MRSSISAIDADAATDACTSNPNATARHVCRSAAIAAAHTRPGEASFDPTDARSTQSGRSSKQLLVRGRRQRSQGVVEGDDEEDEEKDEADEEEDEEEEEEMWVAPYIRDCSSIGSGH